MIYAQKIFIKFGNSCNLNCSYCLHDTKHNEIQYKYNYDIIDWLNSNEVLPIRNSKIRIILIGGEPLLYKNEIYKTIDNIDKNKYEITVITNGVLLDKNLIEYLNYNKCRIVVSWDGTSSKKTRGFDVIQEKFKELSIIDNLKISSLLINESLLFDKFIVINSLIKERIKHNFRKMNLDIKVAYHYFYSDKSIKNISTETKKILSNYNNGLYNPLFSEYNFVKNTYNRNFVPIEYTCGSNIEDFSISSSGNYLICSSNINETNLTIYDNPPEPLKNKIKDICDKCLVKRYCIRPCYYATDESIKSYCKFSISYYKEFI